MLKKTFTNVKFVRAISAVAIIVAGLTGFEKITAEDIDTAVTFLAGALGLTQWIRSVGDVKDE